MPTGLAIVYIFCKKKKNVRTRVTERPSQGSHYLRRPIIYLKIKSIPTFTPIK